MVLFTISIDYRNNGNFVPRVCYKTEQMAVTKANNLPWPSKVRKMTALQCVGMKSRDPEFNIVLQ